MEAVIAIVFLTCVLLVAAVLIKPSVTVGKAQVSLYWAVPLTGAAVLICTGLVPLSGVIEGLCADTAVNPVKIVVLFLSMTFMSVYLDEAGFFRYLANAALRRAGTSQMALFVYLYLTVSVLTVFTSNDIIILTFTPFICYFSKSAGIDAKPYLFAEFVAANTWSMFLMIGNPTNIYLASASGISFMRYASVMVLPTLLGGLTSFVLLYLIFRKSLSMKLSPVPENVGIDDRGALILGLVHLGACTALLTVSSYIGLELSPVTLGFAVSLAVCSAVRRLFRKGCAPAVKKSLLRMPWELVPFVISMFVLVLALENAGVTRFISSLFGTSHTLIEYGAASFLTANLINNIPMSVLFSAIEAGAPSAIAESAAYASIIGSNICAVLTPVGALAGIMWSGILKEQRVKFSYAAYIKYGAAISVPTLLAALGGLALRL